jgi:hypothetical protein
VRRQERHTRKREKGTLPFPSSKFSPLQIYYILPFPPKLVLLEKDPSMSQPDNLGSFISENKTIVKEYVETRMEIYRLQSLRMISKSAGYFAWIIISLFLIFLILLFTGMALGFWFSTLFNSYFKGFGLISLILIIITILLGVFRRALFVNPVIQSIIKRSREEED